MASLRLWGAGTARTLRAIWTAEELGLDYELVAIGPRTGATREADFLGRNPKGKIPYLEDGDFGLSESLAIARYLIERHGRDGPLHRPADLHEQARSDEWCCFVLGELDETALYIVRRHEDLQHIYGPAPAVVAAAKDYCALQLEAAATRFAGPHVMGTPFGLADILLMSCLVWADRVGVPLPAAMRGFHDRVAERPAYRRAVEINQQPVR